MLKGAENIDCFCDYTLTFSNVLCFPVFLLKCVYLQLSMCFMCVWVCVCAFVHTSGSNSGRMERQLPKESCKGERGLREGGVHPSLVVQPCPPASSSSPEASASLEQPFRK